MNETATKDQTDLPNASEDIIEIIEPNKLPDEVTKLNLKLNDKEDKEDYWGVWNKLVNDWNNQYKKNTQYVKVRICQI